MTMYDGGKDLSHDHPTLLLWQSYVPAQVVEQLALLAKLEHEEDVGGAFEVLD